MQQLDLLDYLGALELSGTTPENYRQQILSQLDLLGVDYSNYTLPDRDDENVIQVLPVSGGSDSKALALIMCALFPRVPFVLVFTDTLAEETDTLKEFKKIEQWVGRKVIMVEPKNGEGLFEIIEKNGYLPSVKSRWCTSRLKINALDKWLEREYPDKVINLYVGLRYDEDRFGRLGESEFIRQKLPYQAMKIGRSQVYGLLAATAGISPVYRYASRSGCSVCFFRRASEKIQQLINSPHEFQKGGIYEKLSDADVAYINDSPMYRQIMDIWPDYIETRLKHTTFFEPKPVSLLTEDLPNPSKPIVSKDRGTVDMFDVSARNDDEHERVYAAVAFWTHPWANLMGFGKGPSTGIYNSKFLHYSHSLKGLKQSLAFLYEHLASTCELYHEDQDSMLGSYRRGTLRIALYEIEFPRGNLKLDRLSSDSYTWASTGIAYTQMQVNTVLVHHSLLIAGSMQYRDRLASEIAGKMYPEETWQYSHLQAEERYLNRIPDLLKQAKVCWSGMYTPPTLDQLPSVLAKNRKEAKEQGLEAESTLACLPCSL